MSDRRDKELPEPPGAPGERLHLADRLALRPKEAAEALGISERTMRQVLRELPHLRIGSAVVVPVDALRKWLDEQARQEKSRVDAAVEEVLDGIE